MSAVEWLSNELFTKFKFTFSNDILEEAKELEEKQRDEFAISFYNWVKTEETEQLIIDLQMVGELPKETTTKQLLEIYKKEKGL